jgi:hypothetical protein
MATRTGARTGSGLAVTASPSDERGDVTAVHPGGGALRGVRTACRAPDALGSGAAQPLAAGEEEPGTDGGQGGQANHRPGAAVHEVIRCGDRLHAVFGERLDVLGQPVLGLHQ